jgi:hypothetical protein
MRAGFSFIVRDSTVLNLHDFPPAEKEGRFIHDQEGNRPPRSTLTGAAGQEETRADPLSPLKVIGSAPR